MGRDSFVFPRVTARAKASEDSGPVLLVTVNRMLATGLAAALSGLGWQIRLQEDWSERAAREFPAVVFLADESGSFANRLDGCFRPESRRWIAVGLRSRWEELIRALRQGATAVLDGDQPFGRLVQAADRLLRQPPQHGESARWLMELERRRGDSRRFESLTPRERQVLLALAGGLSAGEIAAVEHLSLPTVRSHIQSLLAKLGVASQLAAVALAQRACAEPELLDGLRRLHQF